MEDQGQGGPFCHLIAKTATRVFFSALGGKDEGFPDQERVERVRSSGVCVYVDIIACESLCVPVCASTKFSVYSWGCRCGGLWASIPVCNCVRSHSFNMYY